MSKSTDERGRLYLPKDVRERFGETYRVVELPSHVALFPVDEDPLEGVQNAVGDALENESVDELKAQTRESIAESARDSVEERDEN